MPDYIAEKRASLEKFIREQMIGPGGCRYHFGLDDHDGEVLNTTPGSIYSTAILFPQKDFDKTESQNNAAESDFGQNVLDADDGESDATADEVNNVKDEEDQATLSRRFPNMMGLSFCLNNLEDLSNNLSVKIKCRYYKKVVRDEFEHLYVNITDYPVFFAEFFDEEPLLNQNFRLDRNENKLYICCRTVALAEELRTNLREKDADLAVQLRERFQLDVLNDVAEGNLYLLSLKEHLFKKLNKNKDGYNEEEACRSAENIKEIEKYETALSYCNDLLEMYNSRSFGFWKEQRIEHQLDLNGVDFTIHGRKLIKLPDDETPSFKNFVDIPFEGDGVELKARLSISMQLIPDVQNGKYYLKFLLQNTSSKFIENEHHFFFIVNEEVNKRSFFGVQLVVESPYIVPYHDDSNQDLDDEEQKKLNYLYRSITDYGVGHFCSVDWKPSEHRIQTEFMPACDCPDVEPVPRNKNTAYIEELGKFVPPPYLTLENRCLELKWLSVFSNTTDEQIRVSLIDFVEKYSQWIDSLVSENDISRNIIDSCRTDYIRMRDNIELILNADTNMRSFRLMNSAMFMQMWHGKKSASALNQSINENFYRQCDDEIFTPGQHAAWRPFQLAFILLNLDGIIKRETDPQWEMRNKLVDLVWFPTGGGKTEAYLGLIAMTIIHRRRAHGAQGGGVSAIMRYTLRLLATQQFERATKLILAIEQLRRLYPNELGSTKVNIGLFVGNDSLPNKLGGPADGVNDSTLWNEAVKWMNRRESKVPLPHKCPWCSDDIIWSNGTFACRNIDCTFSLIHEGLPVELCDELVYQNTPSLLFGTVDKFAQLAHKVSTVNTSAEKRADSRRLFGRGSGMNFLTPDLIIQDELHLLQGPLGSAVGLYESAVDKLCSRVEDGILLRPKIISSTATTRNTGLQIRALYDRDVSVFPKNGTDYDDSFFSFFKRAKNNIDEDSFFLSKRRYLGVMPTGRTQMTTQMRLAAMFFVHRALFEKDHLNELGNEAFVKAADYYYSLISYFNSLREVGKTDAQFYLEFTKYTKRLFHRVLRNGELLECYYANDRLLEKAELTGRLSGSEVVNELKHVDEHWALEERDRCRPPDFILATNMISVGLDVSRFNSIIMNSMPRNIAEYIQASSRVARDSQGLVITLHNPFRSRDISHFEKFKEFHEKMYYYVEPISITPFSIKSIERYWPLYLSTIVRHLHNLTNKNSASQITVRIAEEIKRDVVRDFTERLQRSVGLANGERNIFTEDSLRNIERMTEKLLNDWLDKKSGLEQGDELVYELTGGPRRNGHKKALFSAPDEYEDVREVGMWLVPMSLRIIEPDAVLKISPTYERGY
jgi:hypothetical protein